MAPNTRKKKGSFASAKAGTPGGKGRKAGKVGSPAKESAFKGRFKGSPTLKPNQDNRNVVNVVGLQNGMCVAFVKKANKELEAHLPHDMRVLYSNQTIRDDIGINAILPRRGVDGESEMPQNPGSEYPWRQFLFILGEDNNTAAGRRAEVAGLINLLNENATNENYKYPKRAKFGQDLTTNPMQPASAVMLDQHVVGLLMPAYPNTTLAELKEDEDIVSSFFVDVEEGKAMIDEAIGANASGFNNIEDTEEEDEDKEEEAGEGKEDSSEDED